MKHLLLGHVDRPFPPSCEQPFDATFEQGWPATDASAPASRPKMKSRDTAPVHDVRTEASGYRHATYAKALAGQDRVVSLARSGANLIARPTPTGGHVDLSWAYPILSCQDWVGLADDLADLGRDYVTVSALADPFGDYDEGALRRAFPDLCRVFKHHFVTELEQPPKAFVAGHHRRNVKKARRQIDVEIAADVTSYLQSWTELYDNLIARHEIGGLQRFSAASFRTQFEVPGLEAFVARHEGTVVGMVLWFVQDSVAYYHLGAYAPKGYELRASFALFDTVIEEFRDRGLEWLSLGAGAGIDPNADDGLTRFKRGWSTGTRPAYLLGRVLDRNTFNDLSASRSGAPDGYFPPYRYGEYS